MAQRFLAPSVTFEGIISQNGTPSADAHVITKGWADSNLITGIHSASANYVEVVAESGSNKLKVKPLTITSVSVNSTQADLAAFVSNVYTGSNFQEGDIIFLTTPSPTEAYIHNGGSANNANDWDKVNEGLSDAQIRAKFSASNGINYNSATGAFSADQGEIRGMFSASAGVDFNAATGAISADQGEIRGMFSASGLLGYSGGTFDLTQASVRGVLQADPAAGNLLTYNNGSGDIAVTQASVRGAFSATGLLTKTGGTLDVAQSAVRAVLQADPASGNLLTYNNGSGDIAVTDASVRGAFSATGLLTKTGGTFDVAQSAVRGVLQADPASGNLLTYNNGSGDLAVTEASVRGAFSATGLLTKTGGAFDLSNASVRGAMSADGAAGNLLTYNSGTGAMLVAKSSIRKQFAGQSLSANVALTLTHNLGERLVHVSAMDGSGNHVDLEIVYTNANACAIKSTTAITVDIAVSL